MDAWNSNLWSDGYFRWLKHRVKAPSEYSLMLSILHRIPYMHYLGNDSDRAADGTDLRYSFMADSNLMNTEHIYNVFKTPCSFLELCVGLADRMAVILYRPSDGPKVHLFFWEMMDNLGLLEYTNAHIADGSVKADDIFKIVDDVNMRKYDRNGVGGLFPLKDAAEDQRNVELWYQMTNYINQQYMDYGFLRKN